jgi:hypothetical protein
VNPLRFDEAMNLVEKVRQALNLVNHDDTILRCQFLTDSTGVSAERQINGRIEKIVDPGVGERMANQECLARLPRPEKKIGLLFQKGGQVKYPLNPWAIRVG